MNVYELESILDNPLFDGLEIDSLDPLNSVPADWKNNYTSWVPNKLAGSWKTPTLGGNVRAFNDFPGIGVSQPAFSSRAVDYLRDLLEPNGELLPVIHKLGTYYYYNCTTVSNCLDLDKSTLVKAGNTIVSFNDYVFIDELVENLSIFRLRVQPFSLYCTQLLYDRVKNYGLEGFRFIKIWPLDPGLTLFDERKRARRESEKLRPKIGPPLEVKGNSVILRLYLDRKKPTKAEKLQSEKIESDIEALLYDPNQSSAEEYFGSIEESEAVDYEIRIFISSPDCNRLVEKLRPYLKSLPWSGKFHVVKRFGEYVDESSPVEYVAL